MASFLDGEELERSQEPALVASAGWIVERAEAKIEELVQTHLLKSKSQANELETLRCERDNLETRLKELQHTSSSDLSIVSDGAPTGAVAELANQLSSKNKELDQLKQELDSANAQFSRQSDMLSDLKAEVARRRSETESLTTEVETLSERLRKALSREEELSNQLSEKSSQHTPLVIEVERLKQEIASKESSVEWHVRESETQNEAYRELRQRLNEENRVLQQQLDSCVEDSKSLENQLVTQRSRIEESHKLNNKLQGELSALKQELNNEKLASLSESETLKRLNMVLKQQTSDKEKYIVKLEKTVSDLESLLEAKEDEFNTELSRIEMRMKQTLEEARGQQEGENESLRQKLKSTEESLTASRKRLEEIESDPLSAFKTSIKNVSSLSKTAADEQLHSNGLSSTVLYQKLIAETECKKKEQQKAEKLESLLNQIYRDIEMSAPAIEQRQLDYQSLLDRYEDLNNKLVLARQENQTLRKQLSELKKSHDNLSAQEAVSKQKVQDMAAQLRSVLKGSLTPGSNGGRLDTKTPPRYSNSGQQVISENLVTFESIDELHERNQTLLNLVRKLTADQEEAEREGTDAAESEMAKKWKAAMADLDEMRRARVRQQEMVESIVRQRDMYRVLLAQADAKHALAATGASEGTTPQMLMDVAQSAGVMVGQAESNTSEKLTELLEESRKDFAKFRETTRENDFQMQAALEKARTDLVKAQSEVSQRESELKYQESRYSELMGNVETLRGEANSARDSVRSIKVQLAEQQKLLSTKDEEVESLRQQIRHVKQDKENLSSEKTLLVSEVNQLKSRCQELTSQRDAKEQLISSFKSIEESRTVEHKVTVQSLSADKEQLRGDLKLAHESSRRSKADLVQLELTLTNKLKELTSAKNLAEHEMGSLKSKCEKLEGKLEASASRELLLKEQLSKANRVAAQVRELRLQGTGSMAPIGGTESGDTPSIADGAEGTGGAQVSSSHLESAKIQIQRLEKQLESKNKDVEAYRAISKANEDALQKLSRASEEWKKEHTSKFKHLEEEHKKLKAGSSSEVEELKRRVEVAEKAATEKEALVKELTDERDKAKSKIVSDKRSFEKALKDAAHFRKVAEDAKTNYDRELQLHAMDSASLSQLQKEMMNKEHEVRELTHKLRGLESQASQNKDSWEEQRLRLENQVAKLTSEVDDHRRQNNLLLEQVSDMSTRVKTLQQEQLGGRAGESTGSESSEASALQTELYRLREIQEISKRHLDSAVLEKEEAKHNLVRCEQQLEQLQRKLDAARAEMDQSKLKGDVVSVDSNEYKKLLAAVEENTVLRNMNAFMTGEQSKLKEDHDSAKKLVDELKAKIESLNKTMSEVDADKASTQNEISVLKDNVTLYKDRYDNLVKKFGEKVDPNEHQKLVEELEKAKNQVKEEIKKAAAASEEHKNMEGRLRKAGTNFKQRAQDLQKKLDKQTEEFEELRNKNSKETESVSSSLASANAEIAQQKETIVKSKETILRLQRRLADLKTQNTQFKLAAKSAELKSKAKAKGKGKAKAKAVTPKETAEVASTPEPPAEATAPASSIASESKSTPVAPQAPKASTKRPLDPSVPAFLPKSASDKEQPQATSAPAAKKTKLSADSSAPSAAAVEQRKKPETSVEVAETPKSDSSAAPAAAPGSTPAPAAVEKPVADVTASEKAKKLAEMKKKAEEMRQRIAEKMAAKSSPVRGATSALAPTEASGAASSTADGNDSAPPTDEASAAGKDKTVGSSTFKTITGFGSSAFGSSTDSESNKPTFGQLKKPVTAAKETTSESKVDGTPAAGFGTSTFGKPSTSFGNFGSPSTSTFGSGSFGSATKPFGSPETTASRGSLGFGSKPVAFGSSQGKAFGSSVFGSSTSSMDAPRSVVKFSSTGGNLSDQIAKRKARFATAAAADASSADAVSANDQANEVEAPNSTPDDKDETAGGDAVSQDGADEEEPVE